MTAKKRKVVSIICLVLVIAFLAGFLLTGIGSAFAVSQSQIDALKQQQDALNKKQEALNTSINELEGKMASVVDQKAKLDEQNELARQEIEIINEQIDLYDKLIKQKAQELVEAKKVEAEQKEALRVRMRIMEEHGTMSYISILFKANSFTEFLSLLKDVSGIMQSDKELEEAYIAAREHVEEVKAEYEATQEEQKETRTELQNKKAELEKQIENAVSVIVGLEKDIDTYRKEYEANAASESAIRQQIEQMIADLEKQQQQQGGNANPGSGSFIWPTAVTAVSSAYGNRMHPIFHEIRFHSGIDISAAYGDAIWASDAGTVVTAVSSSSYGNYVVISHGNGNSTLYAHLSAMSVTAGQAVTQGQVIGYVGSTGWSTGPHLHFEVRVGGALVDPESYVPKY